MLKSDASHKSLDYFKKQDNEISLPLSLSHPNNQNKSVLKISENSRNSMISKLIWILFNVFFGKRLMYWENLCLLCKVEESYRSGCILNTVKSWIFKMKTMCIWTLQVRLGSHFWYPDMCEEDIPIE